MEEERRVGRTGNCRLILGSVNQVEKMLLGYCRVGRIG